MIGNGWCVWSPAASAVGSQFCRGALYALSLVILAGCASRPRSRPAPEPAFVAPEQPWVFLNNVNNSEGGHVLATGDFGALGSIVLFVGRWTYYFPNGKRRAVVDYPEDARGWAST